MWLIYDNLIKHKPFMADDTQYINIHIKMSIMDFIKAYKTIAYSLPR